MQAEDIETYLADLGQELQRMGQQQPVRLLLVGGAFMLTQFHNRASTKDVDDAPTSQLYQTFKTATRVVARRNRLPFSWINDVIGDFLRDASIVPQGTLWRTYGPLEVYIPPDDYILALKLLAGRSYKGSRGYSGSLSAVTHSYSPAGSKDRR